ncbi:hypothetical protein Tco_0432099 [Tanacetum coccineum]
MHNTMVPEQVKPQKIQAGVQVSKLEDKDVIFNIRSAIDSPWFIGNLFFCHKVLGVSVLSFKGDKVLQEVSTLSLVGEFLIRGSALETGLLNFLAFRLNIEKLDGNIVQKHGGSKQVGFKQLGPGVETGVHGVSNDDPAVAQKWLEDKQPEEKTNMDCLVKEQEKEYQTGWKIKTGNVLDSYNKRSTQQCMKNMVTKHLGVTRIQQ